MMSAVVCQIPGCSTTQEEIEEELQTYLAGYCQACGKNREGRLCGCAFPCSLTFRGQMLMRIHEILAAPLPLAMKAIQVCYKHPELLKQARETCIALRDNVEESNAIHKPGEVNLMEKVVGNEASVLQALDGQGEDVTSIVYTDETGQEQSLVGQIVYTTGEDGEGNIIIQEVDAGHLVDSGGDHSSRIMKIQFGEDGGFVVAEEGAPGEERDEELEQRLEEELEGREAKLEQELEEEQGKSAMTRIQFSLASEDRTAHIAQVEDKGSSEVAHPPLVDATDPITEVANCSTTNIIQSGVNVQQIQKELVGMEEDDFDGLSDDGGSVKMDDDDPNLLKIQYKEYQLQILSREMRPLLSRTCLCDIEIVCDDGRELTSGLVLGALSPMMRAVLEEVPRLDPFKTLMMPEVSVQDFRVLNKLIFDEELLELTEAEERSIKRLSQTLGCSNLLNITGKKKTSSLPVLENPEGLENIQEESEEMLEKGIKRKAEEQENQQVKKGKLKHIKHTQSLENLSTSIRLDKSELNTDYIDESGLVRLSSADEMAMHYCLVCEGKFKKYNQAITHYDSAHNLLAALACDQCDDTFRDMFSCVKHKHAIHGEFDPNLQCYLCKEVMYSRFRLSTHIKEMHKSEYGEFVCRSCGMKFAAKHYLNVHQEESHNDLANSCSICGKTFSGKRYLTMHMKANHEANTGGGEDLTCQDCERIFPSSRDAAYHNSKVHGAPRPPGSFEDCEHCDKWFKTKGELSQHVSRIHSGVKNNKCAFCEAGFYKESDLKQHLNRHTGAKPFVCSLEDCEASFGFKTALTRHTKNKHGLKPPLEEHDLGGGVYEISNINY